MNPLTSIPPKVRKGLYLVYAVVGLVLGALQVAGLDSLGSVDLSTALAVYAYVGVALGFTAGSNVDTPADPPA
ncbi:MAG: hypothetical protein EPO65_00650 [Dehalococcoidia bacterium]|nr:MAG: hypothetical protein EPO65_00650 [Dehalococcoidia bacterium]